VVLEADLSLGCLAVDEWGGCGFPLQVPPAGLDNSLDFTFLLTDPSVSPSSSPPLALLLLLLSSDRATSCLRKARCC
jgi:hypothetical protein